MSVFSLWSCKGTSFCETVSFDIFFSPLGRLAGRAMLYILLMFFLYFFNGCLRSPAGSEANGPIFTKISGLVDRCKGLITPLSFFLFFKGRCHGNQLKSKKWRFSCTNLLCRAAIRKQVAISQFDFVRFNRMNFSTLCTILVTFGPEIPEFTIAPFAAIRQKSEHHANYLKIS